MASNPYVNKVQKADGTVLIDLTSDTAVASDVAQGKYFHLPTGERVAGTGGSSDSGITQDSNGYIVISPTSGNGSGITQDANGYIVLSSTGAGATQHTIHLEFTDETDTDILVYYDDSLVGSMITAYEPDTWTYNSKTVAVASLDNIDWYDKTSIPLNTQLVDFSKVTNDYIIDGSTGEAVAEQWYSVSDYMPIASGMTFAYTGCRWQYLAFYDSSKVFISSIYIYNDTTESEGSSNIGNGTLSGNEIPSNAAYIRITSVYMSSADTDVLSYIRTA